MDNKQLLLIILAIIVGCCIIAGAIIYSNGEVQKETVPVNNTTEEINITENETVEEDSSESEQTYDYSQYQSSSSYSSSEPEKYYENCILVGDKWGDHYIVGTQYHEELGWLPVLDNGHVSTGAP